MVKNSLFSDEMQNIYDKMHY